MVIQVVAQIVQQDIIQQVALLAVQDVQVDKQVMQELHLVILQQ